MTRCAIVLTVSLFAWPSGAFAQVPAALAAPASPAAEHLAEVRIHGNHTTPDGEVLRIAGLTMGQAVDPAVLEAARSRLEKSGRFEAVEFRKRYRSLEPGGDVALVILVREHPLPDIAMPEGPAVARPFRRLFSSGMFLPILHYNDGYGFTYGGRVSFVDTLGRGSRISIPLSWGATKQAAVEIERRFATGPFDRVFGGVRIGQRTNPFYEIDERRDEAHVEASRQIAGVVRASGHGSYANVRFGDLDERLGTVGADLSVDTRVDPVFPRNAVYLSAGIERLEPSRSAAVTRYKAEARAYRGLVKQAVLSLRVQYAGADGPQPVYARELLGGASGMPENATLRGYRAGSYSGDNLLGATAEIRMPVSSPMGIARAGFTVFADTGTTWDHGERLADARWRVGGGAGVFLLASVFQMNLDVGFREGGGARVHFTTGLQF